MEVNEAEFERILFHEQISEVQILLHHPALVHGLNEIQDGLRIDVPGLTQFDAIESFGHKEAFQNPAPRPAFTQGQVTDNGDSSRFELLRQLPFLAGLRSFEEKLQRTQCYGIVNVAFEIEGFSAKVVLAHALDGGFLHRLAACFQQLIDERREVGLELPADTVVLSLNHAADCGRGTFDCQRVARLRMLPRVSALVKRPTALDPAPALHCRVRGPNARCCNRGNFP